MRQKCFKRLHAVLALMLVLVLAISGLQFSSVEAAGVKGFTVSGTSILDANGNDFIMRGINVSHAWFQSKTEVSLDAAARLGCNTVRVVCADGARWTATTEDELEEIIAMCRRNKMVCVLEAHDATGDNEISTLEYAADYWISVKDVLVKNQDIVILNPVNEWHGSTDSAHWAKGYETILPKLRKAGITNLIMVDCAGWGQYPQSIKDYGKEVFEADPQKNTMLSMHLYEYAGGNATMVKTNIDNALSVGVPICIGEFGQRHTDGDVDEDTILSYCKELGIGYLAWSWKGNNAPVDYLDLTVSWDGTELSEWGERLFFGENGIKETAKTCSVFDGMSTDTPVEPEEEKKEGYVEKVIIPSNNTHHYFTTEQTKWLSEEDATIEVLATTKIEQAGWTNITLVGDRNGKKADVMYPTKAGKKVFSMKAADFFKELGTKESKVVFDNFHVYTWNSTTIDKITIKYKGEGATEESKETEETKESVVESKETEETKESIAETKETVAETRESVEETKETVIEESKEPVEESKEPVDPTPSTEKSVVLKNVSFGKNFDLSKYDYKNIKEIVVTFDCNSTGYSGAVVIGNWVQQQSYCQDDVKKNTVTIQVKNPQNFFTIYKWWSNAKLEIKQVELRY